MAPGGDAGGKPKMLRENEAGGATALASAPLLVPPVLNDPNSSRHSGSTLPGSRRN